MASKCKKCGEKLYPSDTFCGFCGEPVDNVDLGLGEISRVPRPLVGVDALSKKEREVIEEAKIKYRETKQLESEEKRKEDNIPLGKRVEDLRNRINAREMEKKKAVILAERKAAEEAARAEAERKAAEEAARAEAERKAAEEAARAEAERKAAEEAARAEAERKAAEEAARAEAERKAAEEAARAEAERKAAEEAAKAENLERLKAEQQAAEERAAKLEEKARELQEQAYRLNEINKTSEADKKTENDSFEYIDEFKQEDYQMNILEDDGEDEVIYCETKYEPDEEIWGKNAGRTFHRKDDEDASKKKVIFFAAGIIVLIIVIAFLLKNELSGVPGNDSDRTDGSATEQSAQVYKGDDYTPSDSETSWDGSVALKFTEGQGTEENPYIISTGSELAYISEEVNRGVNFSGVYFKLKNDISLGGHDWTPVGYYSMQEDGKNTVYAFSGVFDGDGHTISDFNVGEVFIDSRTEKYSNNVVCGFFGAVYDAEISNLNINNGMISIDNESGEIYAGVLAGCTYDTVVRNCHVAGKVNVNGSYRICAGIFAGAVNGGSLETVTADGELVSVSTGDTNDAGAVAGYVKSAGLKDITSKGIVSVSGSGNVYAGGVCGYAAETDMESVSSENTVSADTDAIDGIVMAGGIAGWQQGGNDLLLDSKVQITVSGVYYVYAGGIYGYAESVEVDQFTGNCSVVSKAAGDASFVISGGAAGLLADTTVSNITVSGTLDTEGANINYAGGIAGQIKAGSLTAATAETEISARSTGTVSGMIMCGGAVGSISEADASEIKCGGSIKTDSQIDSHAGGIFGYINGGIYKNIESSVSIENTAKIGVSSGGFAGYAVSKPDADNCNGTGTRTNNGENIYDDDFIAIVNQ